MSANKNMPKMTMPEPTLRRLPWYLAYVRLLERRNIEYVSSTQISKEINVDASVMIQLLELQLGSEKLHFLMYLIMDLLQLDQVKLAGKIV